MIKSLLKLFFPSLVKEPERARDINGRLVGDDKKTPTFNEAWVGGKAPAKKKAAAKKAAPKKRGRPKGSKTKKK
jgi:hypothetical protein|tara:strand:+ start:478 stop:699 length:222 start_codon:yes stop_codon:yes gene_type:complete